jgi:hypothetical protein
MRTLTTMIAILALGGVAHAARAPKHMRAVVECTTPVGDALQAVAKESKSMMVSRALTDKQYAFIKKEEKEHSTFKKEIPGDGAFIIKSDDSFIVFFIKGADDSAKVCAVMAIPAEIVMGIMTADAPPPAASADKPESKDAPWL